MTGGPIRHSALFCLHALLVVGCSERGVPGGSSSPEGYSSLDSINESNVAPLSVAWVYDAGATFMATPVVADGVVYADADGLGVHAISAGTGRQLWYFEAKVPVPSDQPEGSEGHGVGRWSRGVAHWRDRVYVTARDGRLFALDAATGAPVWERETCVVRSDAARGSISGAPHVVDGRIVVATAGTRDTKGHLTAFDAATGKTIWTFTEPVEPPGAAAEHDTTDWGAMTYDPGLRLLYVSSIGEQPSILGIHPGTGRVQWQYRLEKPQAQRGAAGGHLVLAELEIDGARRRVIMQARPNGQLHVLDRTDGTQISSARYTESRSASFEYPPVFSPKVKLLHLPIEEDGMQYLQAWNPVTAKEEWRIVLEQSTPCAGLLSTSGNRLLQGDAEGYLNVYESEWGEVRERAVIDACSTASPFSYSVGGVQYIGVSVPGRILALRLGGGETNESRTMKRYPRTVRPPGESS